MTCPHCAARLKHRERSGHRCARCGRQFVFEPREHLSRLTDVRVQRAAAGLGDNNRFRYTFGQLTAAVARRGSIPPNFRETMLLSWPGAHGSLPDGLFDERHALTARPPEGPAAAHVLCPDRSVSACLLANDVQRRLGVLVVDDLPPGSQPVLLLDDLTEQAHARLAELRRSGRRALAVGPSAAGTTLVQARPSMLVEWLDLAVRAEARFRDGACRAAAVDFLHWPRPE